MCESTKKTYHHGDLRVKLLESGKMLLEKKGVAGLSLRKVAQSIGVSHNAPYRHFKDKEELMIAIAQSGFENLSVAFQEIMLKYPDEPEKQLVEAGIAYLTLAIRNPQTTNLMFGGFIKKNESWLTAGAKNLQGSFHILVKIIENGQRSGIFKDENSLDLAIASWSGMHGLALLITAGILIDIAQTEDEIRSLGERIVDTLLTGIKK